MSTYSSLHFTIPKIVHEVWTYGSATISIIANVVLFSVVYTDDNKKIDNYRILLRVFCISDVSVTLAHLYTLPAMHLTSNGYIFFSLRFFESSEFHGTLAAFLFVLVYFESFILLTFHFLYRYITFCRPAWFEGMRKFPLITWAMIAVLINLFYTSMIGYGYTFHLPSNRTRVAFAPLVNDVYGVDLFEPELKGFMSVVYENPPLSVGRWIESFVCFAGVSSVVLPATGIVFFCISHIRKALIQNSNHNLSEATRSLQRQLFQSLLIQAAVPWMCSYSPTFSVLVMPTFGIDIGGIGHILMMLMTVYATVDPIFLVFFITGYRRAVIRKVRRCLVWFTGTPDSPLQPVLII